MKKILLFAVLFAMSFLAIAQDSPFQPEVDVRFKKIEKNSGTGTMYGKIAKFAIDAESGKAIGTYGTGVRIPKKAILTQLSFGFVEDGFQSAGTPSMRIWCEDQFNIKGAFNPKTAAATGGFIGFAATPAASAFINSIAASCEIMFDLQTDALTDGLMKGFVEYVSYE